MHEPQAQVGIGWPEEGERVEVVCQALPEHDTKVWYLSLSMVFLQELE